LERVAFVALDDATAVLDFDRARARADAYLCRQTDEGIAAEAFAADHGLQQKGVALVSELEVERERGIEIRERLEDERDAVVPLRGQRAEFGFGHDASTSLST